MNPLLQYWYFHFPNFVLAAIMYSVLGRMALSAFVAPEWKNYIWRGFLRITEPAVKLVRLVTPQGVPNILILIFTVLWLMVLRVAFFLLMGAWGLLPSLGAAS